MAGKLGRSGRKSWDKEIQAKELWDLSVPVLKFALRSPKVNINKKSDIALALVNKMLPQRLEGEGFGDRYTFIGSEKVNLERMSRLVALVRERAGKNQSC